MSDERHLAMLRPMKAALFDLDGVIVDTARYHYIAWREMANGLGFDLTPEQNERLKGVSRMESLDIVLDIGGVELNQEEKTRLGAAKNARYVQMVSRMDPSEILPGAKEYLATDVRVITLVDEECTVHLDLLPKDHFGG